MSLNWEGAACMPQDGGLFFGPDDEPVRTQIRRESRAKAVCAHCPLRAACLDYALAEGFRHGVWGGLGEAELLRLRSGQKRHLTAVGTTEKACTGCGITKPLDAFHRRARSGHEQRCKVCRRTTERDRWREKAAREVAA